MQRGFVRLLAMPQVYQFTPGSKQCLASQLRISANSGSLPSLKSRGSRLHHLVGLLPIHFEAIGCPFREPCNIAVRNCEQFQHGAVTLHEKLNVSLAQRALWNVERNVMLGHLRLFSYGSHIFAPLGWFARMQFRLVHP